ncbi:hypothetical protein LG52_2926 [Geobacillus kaustophilus]|uniref:Uncharacterized protein n=1 Tax=Geobacillus kaustophilus TaxID=1462 RepID=A0A0D8BYF7_GEOKU|nr:hypothetical protein LG52_2926 [Geobacillus kaustophilus]
MLFVWWYMWIAANVECRKRYWMDKNTYDK